MATAQDKMTQAQRKIAENAKVASQVGATYKFVLQGDGGGTFIVNLKDQPSVVEGEGEAECTLTMAADDFVSIMEKKVEAQNLFFEGKLQIEGDMGLAMKLSALIDLMS